MLAFFLGAPGSGSEFLGGIIASAFDSVDLLDFSGLYFAFEQAPSLLAEDVSPHSKRYLADLQRQAVSFVTDHDRADRIVCLSSELNLLVAPELAARFPEAEFIVSLRHYRSAVQYMRTLSASVSWFGSQLEDSAQLWSRYYSLVPLIPAERLVVVSHEQMQADLTAVLDVIGNRLSKKSKLRFDKPPERSIPPDPQPRIPRQWTAAMESIASGIVAPVHEMLSAAFPSAYYSK